MKCANYIISRAGANSIFEFLALKKPTLLIPLSRKASRGDQILNAASFKKEGYALVMEEEEITRESFLGKIKELKSSKDNLAVSYTHLLVLLGKKNLLFCIRYLLYGIYTLTWIPITVQGIIRKNNKEWNPTKHVRNVEIYDV